MMDLRCGARMSEFVSNVEEREVGRGGVPRGWVVRVVLSRVRIWECVGVF